ncbi:MAG TPA: prolyl oligopeptidase family serine peptidase, partial [Allosphingosinicella sp.]|nr:prolyl oligopeptidase family serine peptidase [Allosphingosinicella sp.]
AGANGDTVWGQIVRPEGASGRLPTLLLIHGGPQSSFGNGWSYRWNPWAFAAPGYAAVTIDFHGSTGYGQAFTDAINRDWGGAPLEDLRLGLAAAGREEPLLDTANACALGGSYGGFMVDWIAGQWSDGFKCLVSHSGVFDQRAMAYETEELWFTEWEFGGPYYEPAAAEAYERNNPIRFVEHWRTPMLVIHGERDYRIPYSQSLGAFNALQRRGIPSRLVVFPDENHWILKPQNSIQWYREVHGWLDRWLRPSN